MNITYRLLQKYLPKQIKQGKTYPCLYAYNDSYLIKLLSFNPYYQIIEYYIIYEYDLTNEIYKTKEKKIHFMFITTFIENNLQLIFTKKYLDIILNEITKNSLPF